MFKQSPPEKLCVVRLSAIGDTCHALAVVRAIQDYWPATRITWIIGKTEAGLLADIPDVEFIIFDKNKGRAAYGDIRQQLKGSDFDAALCMHASMRANWVCRAINTRLRIGFDYSRARDFQWLFTNHRIPAVKNEHVLDGMMGFARALSVVPGKLRWDIPISQSDRAFATSVRQGKNPLLVISPCSSQRSRNFRNWSAANYAKIADYAAGKYRCTIALTGGPTALEREYGENISRTAGADVVNLIGKTSLKQLLAVIDESELLVCPDSGPAHMATTVGTPVAGLYATSNPARTGPYLSQALTVNVYDEAVRRYLGKSVDEIRFGTRVRDPGAMDMIDPQAVKSRIDRIFS